MKQLALTDELIAKIKASVGPDVDPTGFAVFEAIASNTRPLTGKDGTIFERATIAPVTLAQMADYISSGNTLPLVSDHELMGTPKGRVFAAETYYSGNGQLELRTLFYLDPTEQVMIQKLNSASLDEVSVSFLASQLLCSECGWDYLGSNATSENLYTRTCANDHSVGQNGVHVELVGLNQFIELSLVSRGAADNAKIVGKSESVIQPETIRRLAAKGFELDGLVCRASQGEDVVSFDPNKLLTDLADSRAQVITLSADKVAGEAKLTTLQASLETATASVTALTAERDALQAELTAAKAAPSNQADYEAALAFLSEVYSKVLTASGADVPAELPKTVADLSAAIKEKTSDLTAILPVGGVSNANLNAKSDVPLIASAFTNRRLTK